jgi:Domain of unknown function (DUF4384)
MKRPLTAIAFVFATICTATVADEPLADEPPTGAKELFGGGSDAEIVSYPPAEAEASKPQPPTRRATSAKKPTSGGLARHRTTAAFGLKYWIELIEPGKPNERVTSSRTFRSGEKIRLHFESNADGHISIVHVGASGASMTLFPDASKKLGDTTIRANVDRVLPSPNHWFRFDTNPGVERLLVFFASEPELLAASFPIRQTMDAAATNTLRRNAEELSGSKDLVVETVEREATYVVNKSRKLLALEITLDHR